MPDAISTIRSRVGRSRFVHLAVVRTGILRGAASATAPPGTTARVGAPRLQQLEFRARGELGGEVSRGRVGEQDPRHHAAAVRAAAQCRIALRQGQRGVDPRALQGVGIRRPYRDFRGAVSDAQGTASGDGQTRRVSRIAPGAAHRRGSDLGPDLRAAAHLQRLFRGRRRDRPAGVRQLRQSRRLREARSARHFGEGSDRHRPIRRRLARGQAEGGGRARRDRLHHLLRSQGRRIFRG